MEFGYLIRVNTREIWKKEEEFNKWLVNNIDVLANTIDMDLVVMDVESEIGEFRADIIAKDLNEENNIVVIETQLSRTDHEHLGKIITYAAGRNASAVVWISPEFREEHRSALDWLNSITDNIMFFGLELEILKIDNSNPAVRFNIVSKPDEWRRREAAKTILSGRGRLYKEFFQELADRLCSENLAKVRGKAQNKLSIGAGKSDFWYEVVFKRDKRLCVEFIIDAGDYDYNIRAFNSLIRERETIEKEIGVQLEWISPEPLRRARITACYSELITIEDVAEDPDMKEEIIKWCIDTIKRFKQVFTPRIQNLQA